MSDAGKACGTFERRANGETKIDLVGGMEFHMESDGSTASILLFIALLLIDMFFYGFGAALDVLNEKEIDKKADERKDKKSLRLKKMFDNPTDFVNTSHLATTLVNVAIGAIHLGTLRNVFYGSLRTVTEDRLRLSGIPADALAVTAAVLSTALLLYITLTLGVLLPRKIAARIPERWAYLFVAPVYLVTRVLSPFTALASVTSNAVLRLFGVNVRDDETDVTEEEIISMINEGHEQGVIQASEAEMISNIFELEDKEAQDIMTHRKNIVALDSGMLLRDAIRFVLEGQNSRYPVYEENIDHIIGILHLKDAMCFHADESRLNFPLRELDGLLREPYFVPRTKNIDELFREMQAGKLQMVIVVDEYGQTDGLVAMEDILEEIVGNIMDEYDEDSEYLIEKKGEDEYVIEGMTPLEELEQRFGISFADEEFETLNGFLISRMDKIPGPEEQFEMDYLGYHFKLLSVENKRIQSVLVTKLPEVSGDQKESALDEDEKK